MDSRAANATSATSISRNICVFVFRAVVNTAIRSRGVNSERFADQLMILKYLHRHRIIEEKTEVIAPDTSIIEFFGLAIILTQSFSNQAVKVGIVVNTAFKSRAVNNVAVTDQNLFLQYHRW